VIAIKIQFKENSRGKDGHLTEVVVIVNFSILGTE
jgi:hypothetical protein